MTMDFFESEDAARRKTWVLTGYFLFAVALIVLAVYLVFLAIFFYAQGNTSSAHALYPGSSLEPLWNPPLFLAVALSTVTLILLGSLYKIRTLAGGGTVVAYLFGARPVDRHTEDLDERKLLNVVEEMAIASGTPVPPVFLLDDEPGINAFAAGFRPNDAVITVTRGGVALLSRDELQGVIAHEFSHILNGDMRLNIRLMGLLNGILLIAIVGYWLLRASASSDKKKGGAALAILGLCLLAIGYIGVFFGKLIKSAVSRQREFLADASAVQFTRNPPGIVGALKKIGGLARGARLESHRAEEASHMFFGNALRESFLGLMSTHPPLPERIRRIDPSFDGTFPEVASPARTADDLSRLGAEHERLVRSIRARSPSAETAAAARARVLPLRPAEAVARIGAPGVEHLAYAAALVSAMPDSLTAALREPFGASAVIYALLLNDNTQTRDAQLHLLAQHAGAALAAETERMLPIVQQISPEAHLPLVGMALPALHNLSQEQYHSFEETVRQLVQADQKMGLFEYALQRVLLQHLAVPMQQRKPPVIQYYSIRPLLPACRDLLSTLAYVGQADAAAASQAFHQGAEKLALGEDKLEIVPLEEAGLKQLDRALGLLGSASPQIKKRVLEACAACIGADGRLTVEEGELLRVIADSLDCPLPPLMAGR